MGCTSSRDEIYEIKQPELSNRDINETKCELQPGSHQLSPYACGYEFGISVQNQLQFSPSKQEKAKQEKEFQKLTHFKQSYQQMKTFLQGSKIDQAYQLQIELKKEYDQLDFDVLPELKNQEKQEMLTLVDIVRQKYSQLKGLQKELTFGQWKETYGEESPQVKYFRSQQDCAVFTEAEADVGLQLMVATFGSLMKFSQFIKFSQASKQIKKLNTFNRLGEITYDIPFCPQTKTYVQETVFNRIAHDGSVIVSYQSLLGNNQTQKRLDYFPVFQNECKLDYSKIICRMSPLSSNKTKIEMLFRIKGQVSPVAEWVTDKMFKNIGVTSTKQLIEKAWAFGEETDTQIFEGDNQLYHHLHTLMKAQAKKSAQ